MQPWALVNASWKRHIKIKIHIYIRSTFQAIENYFNVMVAYKTKLKRIREWGGGQNVVENLSYLFH